MTAFIMIVAILINLLFIAAGRWAIQERQRMHLEELREDCSIPGIFGKESHAS